MPNMKSIISGHNKKILRGEKPVYPAKKDCNCREGKVPDLLFAKILYRH